MKAQGEAAARPANNVGRDAQLGPHRAASLARFGEMFDRSSPRAKIGVWECELKSEALSWTGGVYDLFELPRSTALQRARILDLYSDESRREMEYLRARMIRGAGGFSLDIRVQTARGNERWLRLTADVEQHHGTSVRIFGAKQDITEERLALERMEHLRAELIHASRRSAMGALAATLAHDLNQPLAAISCHAAGALRALRRPGFEADLEAGLAAIERNALSAGALIRTMRTATRDSRSAAPATEPNAVIREACALVAAQAGELNIRYGLADGVSIAIDPLQFQHVIINLLQNAVDAVRGRPSPEIAISSSRRGDAAEFRIEDNGPGIDPAIAGSIFDSFVSSKPGRSGLGLSIGRTIVEAHGGRITAANRDGGGASFRVSIPLARSRHEAARSSASTATHAPE